MSKQIAVRLPEDLVAYIDGLVKEGEASSRAAVVAQAVEQVRRRERAARDVAILTEGGVDDDLDHLAAFGARVPFDELG